MSLPFYTGQIPTADDFNTLAVKAELAAPAGASQIGYGASTVAAALAAMAAPPVTMVNTKTGAVVLTYADVGAAAQHRTCLTTTGDCHVTRHAEYKQ